MKENLKIRVSLGIVLIKVKFVIRRCYGKFYIIFKYLNGIKISNGFLTKFILFIS